VQVTARNEHLLENNTIIAKEEFKLTDGSVYKYTPSREKISISKNDEYRLTLKNKNFTLVFDNKSGNIISYQAGGRQIFTKGLLPNFWRAPNDNDYGANLQKTLIEWKDAGIKTTLTDIKSEPQNEQGWLAVTVVKSMLNGDATYKQILMVDGNGSLHVSNTFTADKGTHKMLMRFGNHSELPTDFTDLQWYGRGPGENYQDRITASMVGLYSGAIKDQYYPYIRPQESGNKTAVRWAKLTRKDGSGIMIAALDTLLSINALPYSAEQLFSGPEKQQKHSGELEPDKNIHLDIDLQQMGVGGINSWGEWPLEKYRMPYKDYSYSFMIIPIRK
jgi:beta-galactosidase